jgi:2-oxoglutarate dehydrogenase E1 component
MTPKSLLRLPAASSAIDDLSHGGFQPLIDDAEISDREAVKRVVMCSGKVYYDLVEARKKSEDRSVAIVRLEQFYPFPLQSIREMLARYVNAHELVWAQEEPQNMGGWTFVQERLENLLPNCERPRYVGRSASASPATGSYSIHQKEQAELVAQALKSA